MKQVHDRSQLRRLKLKGVTKFQTEKYSIIDGDTGYFHGFSHYGGDSEDAETNAIVELDDGRVLELYPGNIHFIVDGKDG